MLDDDGTTDRGSDGTEPAEGRADQTRDPALRAAVVALVDTMATDAGSNRRLGDASGVSEATVRAFRAGRLPMTSTAKARQLDDWAAARDPDHPRAGTPGSLTDLLARWQGRPVDEPDVEEPSPAGPGRRPGRVKRVAGTVAVLAVLAALVAEVVRLRDDGSAATGVAGVRVDRDLPLDDDNFCAWVLGDDPIPLVSVDPLVVRVDARCNDPAEPDPVLDVGASVYDRPDNRTGERVARIRSGNTAVPDCWVTSTDSVADAAGNRSRTWLHVVEPDGWLPVVNVGGGYTEQQLTALGLPAC